MKLHGEVLTVRTAHPFVIARGGSSTWNVVWARIADRDGVEGWGEAAPSRYYGESAESVMAAFTHLAPILSEANPWSLEATEAALETALRRNGAARSAISAALHDLAAKRLGVPLHRLWGLDAARAPKSSFTIGIPATMDELRRRLQEAAAYPILKVKLGSSRDEEIMRVLREVAPEKTIRVDANAAWTPSQAIRMIALLEDYGVEFVEQPVAPADIDGLRRARQHARIPIIADEACITSKDIPRLAGAVDGINIKLSKCGSLREALRMIAVARAHDMLVMAGCMIETSLGVTAAAHFSPLLDYADLDGAALLADDPFVGATMHDGQLVLPSGPGLGVTKRAG